MIVIFTALIGFLFYGTALIALVGAFQSHGPQSMLLLLFAWWMLTQSGVYTQLEEIVRAEPLFPLWPKRETPPDDVEHKPDWRDDLAPAAWRSLLEARDIAAAWYDRKYLPPRRRLPEWARVAIEYPLLGLGWLTVFVLLYLARRVWWPFLPVTPLFNVIVNILQGVWLVLFSAYTLFGWFMPWVLRDTYPEPHRRHAERAVENLGGWANLGAALDGACGKCGEEAPRLTVATIGKSLWLVIPAAAKLFLAPSMNDLRAIARVDGGLLLALAVIVGYFLVQFWRVLKVRWQARHPAQYSPCVFFPLRALLAHLREVGHID